MKIVKDMLAEEGRDLCSRKSKKVHKNIFPTNYKPKLDTSPECDKEHASQYRQLIGILRWAIELGRIDILLETSIMSPYQAAPRQGHLEALYLIFHFLDKHPFKRQVFDPDMPPPEWNERFNLVADWTEFYGDIKEEVPPDAPKPLGEFVKISGYVDSNHAGNVVTRRSHTGIFIFLNNALITVCSKC